MAENVRDVIRAAQAAELGGDKVRAVELLRRAAALYRRSGSVSRAEQLLRYALKLDPSRASELEEELRQLEVLARVGEEEPASSALGEDSERGTWVLEEDTSGSLAEALRQAELAMDRRLNPVAVAAEVVRAAALAVVPEQGGLESVPPAAPVAAPVVVEARREDPHPNPLPEGEGAFIERGPTRADPSLDAWCSFCCRPRAEVGSLVAGPAGAFICSACIGESSALLGGVASVVPAARGRARASDRPGSFALVGQESAREAFERALAAGVRRVLLLGPEGSGKSTWMRALAEQGRGVRVTPDSLDRAPLDTVLLVEDVDRLPPTEQAALAVFLARHAERTVVMTTRGEPAAPGLVLLSDAGSLSVPTTAALSEAVRGALPIALLEQVQSLVPLEKPGVEDLCEIARRWLASREKLQLSDEALTALATEAAGSPRSGHELQALLARVPPGTWRLEGKKAKPRGKAKPVKRGRRKGQS